MSVARRRTFLGELDGFWSCVASHKMIMIAPRRSNTPHERRIADYHVRLAKVRARDCAEQKKHAGPIVAERLQLVRVPSGLRKALQVLCILRVG